jgi:MFS family permease
LAKYYDSEISAVSSVGSLFLGMSLIAGPITGGLIKKFGLRPVCISGSVVLAIGLALSPLSPNIQVLIITQGLIGGFGASLLDFTVNIAPNYYFETNNGLALGITRCGTGILHNFIFWIFNLPLNFCF